LNTLLRTSCNLKDKFEYIVAYKSKYMLNITLVNIKYSL